MTEKIINGQNDAIRIEKKLCTIFECDIGGLGGIVNAGFIRQEPYTAMMCGLSFIYASSNNVRKAKIEKFATDYFYYSNLKIDEILSEEKEKMEDMFNDFKNIYKEFYQKKYIGSSHL